MTATLSGLTLKDHWVRMMDRLHSDKEHLPIFEKLHDRYAHPYRDYHGLGHLADVLEGTELLADELDLDVESRGAVSLAACYHDSVLSPLSTTNEVESVEHMIQRLGGVRLHPLALSAATLGILGTIPFHEPQGRMAKIVSDADVLILATSWPAYLRYANAVKREYRYVYTDAEYTAGRIEVLRALIDTRLFYYAAGEEKANDNMRREIELLKGRLP